MVKRSIEQDIRNNNFGIRNGNFEKNAVVKNPGNKTAWTKNSWRWLGRYTILPQVNEPNVLDNFDCSETSAMIFQDESVDMTTMKPLEKRYLHHCSLRNVKNQRTWDKLITLMKKMCCQLNPFSHDQVGRDPYTNKIQICLTRPRKERIRILIERQKEQILAEVRQDLEARTSNRVWWKKHPRINMNCWFSASGNWLYSHMVCAIQANYQNKIGIFVKLVSKVFMRWKNWREFKNYESINFREDWSKMRTLSMNSRPEFRNFRMKSIVWMTREILRMLSQCTVDSTFPVYHRYFHLIVILVDWQPATISHQKIWNSHGFSGNVFANPPASSSSPHPGEFNPWIF